MVESGYAIDDCLLNVKERRDYIKDLEKANIKKQLAVQILKQFIVPGSGAEAAISHGYNIVDFRVMWFDLLEFYEGLLLSNAIKRVYVIHSLLTGENKKCYT
jgi:hypothetical protein